MTRCRIAALLSISAGLLPAQDLAFQRLSLHQYDDGPMVAVNYEHLPGETLWFSARITGYTKKEIDKDTQQSQAKLTWKAQPEDPEGVPIVEPLSGTIDEVLLSQDKDWVAKVMVSFLIPPFAPGGTYKIPISVHDELGNKDLTGEIEFRVRGEPMVTAETLGVRNFRFLARETDRFGMQPAIYSPGDTLYARFDIVGYDLGGKNHFDVAYGMAIHVGDKELFAQPDGAADSGEGFYPQRWVPGGFSINLSKEVASGMYTLVVHLRDNVGGTTAEVPQSFEVR